MIIEFFQMKNFTNILLSSTYVIIHHFQRTGYSKKLFVNNIIYPFNFLHPTQKNKKYKRECLIF